MRPKFALSRTGDQSHWWHYYFGEGNYLVKYRNAVAKYIKLLIRARAKDQPTFQTQEFYDRWHLSNIADDRYSQLSLVIAADQAEGELSDNFIMNHGSGGVQFEDPLADLRWIVNEFHGSFCAAKVLETLKADQTIDWPNLAPWDLLPEIRDWLDSLPDSDEQLGDAPSCPVILGPSGTSTIFARGKEFKLTKAQFDIVKALVEVYPDRPSKEDLERKSCHTDAVNVFKRMLKKNPKLTEIFSPAETTSGGYGFVRDRQ